MKIEEILMGKKDEINSLHADIKSLEDQVIQLKDHVLKYNELKKQSSELKKYLKLKKKNLDIVLSFFMDAGGDYQDKIYPLFSDMPKEKQDELVQDEKSGVDNVN